MSKVTSLSLSIMDPCCDFFLFNSTSNSFHFNTLAFFSKNLVILGILSGWHFRNYFIISQRKINPIYMVGKLHQHSKFSHSWTQIYILEREILVIRTLKVNKSSNCRIQYFYPHDFYQSLILPKKCNLINILNMDHQFLHLIHSAIQGLDLW